MKKTLMMLLFVMATIGANAQRGYGGGRHNNHPQFYGGVYCAPPRPIVCSPVRFNCNPYNRGSLINVVIAPRPRVYAAPNPQPQVVREWVEPHWEEGANGRVWVEGHYVQREVY